jgi:hypothetical protein
MRTTESSVLITGKLNHSLIPLMEFVADRGTFVYQMNVGLLDSSSSLLSSGLRSDELLIYSGLLAPVETSIHIMTSLIRTATCILCSTMRDMPPKSLLDLSLSCLERMETPLRQVLRSPGFVTFLSNIRLLESVGQLLVLISPFASVCCLYQTKKRKLTTLASLPSSHPSRNCVLR